MNPLISTVRDPRGDCITDRLLIDYKYIWEHDSWTAVCAVILTLIYHTLGIGLPLLKPQLVRDTGHGFQFPTAEQIYRDCEAKLKQKEDFCQFFLLSWAAFLPL